MKRKLKNVLALALRRSAAGGVFALAALAFVARPAAAWEPSKTVEFIVPAGTGGGADQMARFLQGVIAKHISNPS